MTTFKRTLVGMGSLVALGLLFQPHARASFIETSASCPGSTSCEGGIASEYGYTFRISDDLADSLDGSSRDHSGHADDTSIFHTSLLNTSTAGSGEGGGDPLIDGLWFNMDAELGTDFDIVNISPSWTFQATSGAVQFDYVGDTDTPGDRIAANEALVFDFDFVTDMTSEDAFALWTGTDSDVGKAIGAGEESGQVAVSFQSLAGGASDLLTSTWDGDGGGGTPPGSVPTPNILSLLALGLVGLAFTRRSRSIF